MSVPVLVVTGPVAVGKTTIALEMSSILLRAGIPHAVIDLDSLAWCYPASDEDPFNNRLAFRNLAAVWRNYHSSGIQRLIIARVVEVREELSWYHQAVPGADITVLRLRASVATLHERIASRERGAGQEWHRDRAGVLARLMDINRVEDHLIETDNKSVANIAEAGLRWAGWL